MFGGYSDPRVDCSLIAPKARSAAPDLRGNTLRTYLHVIKDGPCELREVQRAMGFSTASLASYHLNKLLEVGYVKQDEKNRYVALDETIGEVLEGYSKIGSAIVPQSAFLAVFLSILTAYLSYQALRVPGFVPYLVVVAIGTALSLWYETFKVWRKLAI